MTTAANFIDPDVLASVENLELRARLAVEGYLGGLHRSPHRGFSVEFTDYRHYNQGDDTRHIDWKLYGRSDKLYIRQFEDETNSRCTLLLDTSASMSYGSNGLNKLEYARTLAAALAYLMVRQRDAAGLITFSEQVDRVFPAQCGKEHLARILRTLVHLRAGAATDLTRPLRDLAANLRSRGFVILISDLLEDEKASIKLLQQMRSMGHEVIVFHVMDQGELEFPFREATEFVDAESGSSLVTSPGAIRDEYLEAVGEYLEFCRDQCQSHGIDYCLVNTREPLDRSLATYLTRRRRGF